MTTTQPSARVLAMIGRPYENWLAGRLYSQRIFAAASASVATLVSVASIAKYVLPPLPRPPTTIVRQSGVHPLSAPQFAKSTSIQRAEALT